MKYIFFSFLLLFGSITATPNLPDKRLAPSSQAQWQKRARLSQGPQNGLTPASHHTWGSNTSSIFCKAIHPKVQKMHKMGGVKSQLDSDKDQVWWTFFLRNYY
jgi:hypothetical protein